MNSSDSSLDIKVNMDKIQSDPGVTLTIRLIMQSKEVGSIIGKGGEIVKRFREESGAKINISDGSCSERIVTVTGTTSAIYKAFLLICKKFEDYCYQFVENGSGGSRPPITLRLIVPASQCGSLIGRGGCKIKEIREECRASIQVASDMLPNSTERAVTVTGTGEAITQCIYHICVVMLECPPKGVTIPYRPKPQVTGPVILAGGQAYTIQGNYAVPAHGGDVSSAPPAFTGLLGPPGPSLLANALMDPLTKNAHLQAALPPTNILPPATAYEIGKLGGGPLAGLAALGLSGLGAPTNAAGINPAAALAAIAGSQLRGNSTPAPNNRITQQNSNSHQTHELTVPNDLIGCIIGKGGSKIAEIRQISGAMIRISNCEEREGGSTDRTISISGNPDAVALAQYLINMSSVELQKQNLESQNPSNPGGGVSSIATSSSATPSASTTPSPLAGAIPLAQLLAKPGALNALSSLSALSGLTDLLGGDFSNHNTGNGPPIQITGVHQSKRNYSSRSRSPNQDGGKLRNDRNERSKFAPY